MQTVLPCILLCVMGGACAMQPMSQPGLLLFAGYASEECAKVSQAPKRNSSASASTFQMLACDFMMEHLQYS